MSHIFSITSVILDRLAKVIGALESSRCITTVVVLPGLQMWGVEKTRETFKSWHA
jgi:hypothetical protein